MLKASVYIVCIVLLSVSVKFNIQSYCPNFPRQDVSKSDKHIVSAFF